MMRYARAFVKAIQMTLKGETISREHYQPLKDWIDAGSQQLSKVLKAANDNGLHQEQRQNVELKLDGRMTSLEQTLQMVRHNFELEYPKLIQLDDPYTMMVIQSSNMNDQYRVSQFAVTEQISSPDVKAQLDALSEHLMNLPTIERPEDAQD